MRKPNKPERSTLPKYMNPSTRYLRRSDRRSPSRKAMHGQYIPPTAVLVFTKSKKGVFKKGEKMTAPLSWKENVKLMKEIESDGFGKIKINHGRTVWHDPSVKV